MDPVETTTTSTVDGALDTGFAPAADFTPWLLGGGTLLVVVVLVAWWRSRVVPVTEPPGLEDRSALDVQDLTDAATPERAPLQPPTTTLVERLRDRMSRTRDAMQSRLDGLFGGDTVDPALLEALEDTLLLADVGVPTTNRLVDALRARVKHGEDDPSVLRTALRDEARAVLTEVEAELLVPEGSRPFVVLVVGVNGSGKTTTIGKLAARFTREGHRVMLAAGDTYRAAAAEQLEVWATRAEADIVRHDEGADPGAVVFDALDAALARGSDIVLVDTAGRLQTQRPLMEQLEKVRRVIDKKVPGAPHATLLVIDGTMGQNAMSQAQRFHAATPLTGVVVTKLDGTAKGGMVLAIAAEMKLPVLFVGIGEQVDDLRPFEPNAFVDALV